MINVFENIDIFNSIYNNIIIIWNFSLDIIGYCYIFIIVLGVFLCYWFGRFLIDKFSKCFLLVIVIYKIIRYVIW